MSIFDFTLNNLNGHKIILDYYLMSNRWPVATHKSLTFFCIKHLQNIKHKNITKSEYLKNIF